MGFLSTFAKDLIDGEPVKESVSEIQSLSPKVIELETKNEVETEEIAA